MSYERDIELIQATARELYGRAVYSHKAHEYQRQIFTKSVSKMNRANIGLAGLTTVLAVTAASLHNPLALISTAVGAAASVCAAVWQASSDPVSKEHQQRTAAKEILCIRDEFLLLIQKCRMSTADASELQVSLESLTAQLLAAYKFMPNTEDPAYTKADEWLKKGNFKFSDDEIDGFLPTELRKRKG